MLERELKFHVPTQQRKRLKARLRNLGAEPIELHARYYDTDDQALARARIALRLRREGEQWVQTVKTPGPDELSRIELNHPRPDATLDLSVYADTSLAAQLAGVAARLQCRYITRITRLKKELPTGTGTVEVAYDEGAILAGGIGLPVHELEIEGISGEAADLFLFAREWLGEHRLVLDLRSKATRGDALAALALGGTLDVRRAWDPDAPATAEAGHRLPRLAPRHVQRLAAAVRAGQPCLPRDIPIREAYLECANECMSQIVRNSGFLAGLDGMQTSAEQRIDYVHQIRVGMRRLRTCWQLFDDTAHPPDTLTNALKQWFRVLGQARDLDVIQTELLPRLMQAGMPPDTPQASADIGSTNEPASRSHLTATPEYQRTLLELLEHLVLYGGALRKKGPGKRAAPALSKRLNAWLARIRRGTPSFLDAGWDERHRMRKHVKRLRYGMEFAQGVLDAARLAPLRNALVSAQKALGQLNDLYVAAEYYRGPGARHPSAMFALGWLAATQEHEAHASSKALHELSRAGDFHPAADRPRKNDKR